MAASSLSVALLKVILDVDLRLALIILQVLLCHGDVGKDQDLEQDLEIGLDKVAVTLQGCALTQVPHNREDEPFALTVSSDFAGRDLLPNFLEEQVRLTLKELCKFELIELHETNDLGSRSEKLFKVRS